MDMGMGGMDMSHSGMTGIGSDINHAFARDYWYISAVVVAILMAVRGVNHIGALQRLKAARDPSISQPTRPLSFLGQAWATATAMAREMGHPQLLVSLRGFSWATPPPLGRVLVLLAYWAMIVYFMAWRVSVHDVNYWERIGYRNAWVTLTQLPMLYLLSAKVNIIGFLVGTSHERLNWLHRWVARTMFVTATCHGFHFWTEWVRADFVAYELSLMPMVRYGLGAWGILLWSVVAGFLPIRRLSYELWLLQHVAASVVMLVLVYLHVPTNGRYLFWMTVSFLVFDRVARWALLLWQNLHFGAKGSPCQGKRRIGHKIMLRAVGDSTTVAVIKDVQFHWTAGQHLYLWIPRLGPLEAHPYTIACASRIRGTCCCNSIQLIVRKHKGFSKRLHDHALQRPNIPLTGFLSGPYGAPPRWDIYETMVLIGASTGASFTVPILESAANADTTACLRRMDVVLTAKTKAELEYYLKRSRRAGRALRGKGVDVRLHVAITGCQGDASRPTFASSLEQDSSFEMEEKNTSTGRNSLEDGRPTSGSTADTDTKTDPKANLAGQSSCCCTKPGRGAASDDEDEDDIDDNGDKNKNNNASHSEGPCPIPESITEYTCRPDLEALIRDPVEHARGETAVVVCGGPEVVARTRNRVSALSDERAVHKGTGAQGIYLHVEEYSF
ncbi:Ferric/cupric reductase transmembrane component 7 [Escovopsis weberi]|uniref:ferric-chelate reductase (NADPH) n=1 Tax=Escovopsis weberi TaxID=150374 RepID=A0A0M8MZ42_ESCWE|nr:Ferric/cupric reductase transmembrane component 7 [Escovopsis weberi]